MNGPSSRTPLLFALSVLPIAAVLSACGSSSPATNGEQARSATQIYADAQRATSAAPSVHVAGRITSGSDKIALDFVDTKTHSGGTVTEQGATFQVILSGKTIYLKASAASFTKISGDKAAGQLFGGRWLQTSTDDKDYGSFAQLFDLPTLVKAIKPTGTLHKGPTAVVGGKPVIGLVDSSHKGTLYVATTGQPYMVELVGGPGHQGTIAFDQYGSAAPPAIPTGAVNLDTLQNS